LHIRCKLPRSFSPKDLFRLPATEAPDHRSNDRTAQ
jgi:hypothetical protein